MSMKKIHLAIVGALVAIIALSCTQSRKPLELPMEYQEYLNLWDEDKLTFIIGDDGDGRGIISHHLRYYELPKHLLDNSFADSLAQIYNMALAFNTISYDCSTLDRYLSNEEWDATPFVDTLIAANFEGVRDPKAYDALKGLVTEIVKNVRDRKSVGDRLSYSASDQFYEAFYGMINAMILGRYNPDRNDSDTKAFEPSDLIPDYESIHLKAITDTTAITRSKILEKYLLEEDFQKKCIYAREFAYANCDDRRYNCDELIAVIDPLLKADEYSPLLRELWLIWRATMQIDILGGRSNYSSIYNLLYNDMRTRQVSKFIEHLVAHPNDELAFTEYLLLLYEYNVVRSEGFLSGNSANTDEYKIYKDCMGI